MRGRDLLPRGGGSGGEEKREVRKEVVCWPQAWRLWEGPLGGGWGYDYGMGYGQPEAKAYDYQEYPNMEQHQGDYPAGAIEGQGCLT
jgi:hypothetical protein